MADPITKEGPGPGIVDGGRCMPCNGSDSQNNLCSIIRLLILADTAIFIASFFSSPAHTVTGIVLL